MYKEGSVPSDDSRDLMVQSLSDFLKITLNQKSYSNAGASW